MTNNEQRLTAMIKFLIKGAEQETLRYHELEKARKLVFEIENQDSHVQWKAMPQNYNAYDKLDQL